MQTKAYEQCAQPWPAEALDPDGLAIGPDPAEQFTKVKRFVGLFNTAAAKRVRCDRIGRAARDECGGTDIMVKANRAGALEVLRLQAWQSDLMGAMLKVTTPPTAPISLNCLLTPREGVPVQLCYALDPARSHTRVVTEADSDVLGITVGMSPNCTFTVLPDGRLLAADHCGPNSLKTAMIMKPFAPEQVVSEFSGSLKASAIELYTGASFEDLAVWKSNAETKGKPFYFLTLDQNRDGGCAIIDDFYLACAPTAFHSLNGLRATVLGFPVLRNSKRLTTEVVMQSTGDVRFDKDTNRILIHASISPGSSGGPTIVPAGANVGGVVLDRPLYLGPVTNFNLSRMIKSVFATDMQVVVGVYHLEHVREILKPPR